MGKESDMEDLKEIGKKAKKAASLLGKLGVNDKNNALLCVADALTANAGRILTANAMDTENAVQNHMNPGLIDRLRLDEKRIGQMAEGIRQVVKLEDPVGEVLSMKKRPNGLLIGVKRVPLGVIGIIYESRPNVTADAFALCFKTGNAVILRGGSDAIHSNQEIVKVINEALAGCGIDYAALQLITDTNREIVKELLRMNEYVDVIIPRGGAGLIKMVVENSTVPVIETGTGNCHVFVDESADFDMALDIIENAKTQRIGVCNACESLVVHKNIAKEFIPLLVDRLKQKNVEIRGDEMAQEISGAVMPAVEEDWGKEYLDYILSCRIVDTIDEAIAHINRYNTGHSEAIITKDYNNAQKFLDEIDAACVYVNASTRFTDGFEFGFGAEIGISTQKLHARGPMGLKELTTTKYIIYGNGQIRE
ncbi:MAG: glutamate-5-semialdehyde dehydrogenase [Thermoflexaceae bacterium]|nr:glutamate-5-semialdehyde dehydrogenase [Thermoflexaceae bacterium]